MSLKKILVLLIVTLLVSCGEGYENINGKWHWVLHSEAGKHVRKIDADTPTFKVLPQEEYATDKHSVFWRGIKIEHADPKTFEVISENGYSKDHKHVFLDHTWVILANPATFKPIQWPYAKDDKRIYNGNLPMEVGDIDAFEITNPNGSKTTSLKSHFITWNKGYKWLDTIVTVQTIIVGDKAEGSTKTEKFKGFQKID